MTIMTDIQITIPEHLLISSYESDDEIKITISKKTYDELIADINNLKKDNDELLYQINRAYDILKEMLPKMIQ